tara:strand:+ start:174 stop:443 length:270 start_codon:yes stop_codon:yes gene_type:complete
MSINKEKTIICEFCLRIIDKSFTGKKPPEEIKVKARLRELNALIEKILRITKIIKVNSEYNNNILTACLNISELSKEIKFVSVFLKFSS